MAMLVRFVLAAAIGVLAAPPVTAEHSSLAARAHRWTSAGTTRGVTLEFRDDPELEAREVRAHAELGFPASHVATVVCDFSAYGTLVPGVTESTRLDPLPSAGTGPAVGHFYLRYAPRFLIVAARDVVVSVQRQPQTDGVERCQWSEVEGRVPPRDGTVRIPLLRGEWTAVPLDASRTNVTYRFAVQPGGRLPGWLVRRGATGALVDVIDNLRALLRQRPAATP
jgi:hypothetical protein